MHCYLTFFASTLWTCPFLLTYFRWAHLYLQCVLFVDSVSELSPLVEPVKLKFTSVATVVFQELLLWPLVLQTLESAHRVSLSLWLLWILCLNNTSSGWSLNSLYKNSMYYFLCLFWQLSSLYLWFRCLRSIDLRLWQYFLGSRGLYLWFRGILPWSFDCSFQGLLLVLRLWSLSLGRSLVILERMCKSSCLLISILLSKLSLSSGLFLLFCKSLTATLWLLQ